MNSVYDDLKEEIVGLPDEKMEELLEFARFLKAGLFSNHSSHEKTNVDKNTQQESIRKIGFMADGFVSIASDFDTCLEGMEDYI